MVVATSDDRAKRPTGRLSNSEFERGPQYSPYIIPVCIAIVVGGMLGFVGSGGAEIKLPPPPAPGRTTDVLWVEG